ncbi:MAG: hypothetical protein JO128_01750 [Alphaproteobacteria bacterium]|nr:hypothetical protein [Alphaproteobacteria bacterium]
MDRRMLLEHLAMANRHVEKGERHVRRQRELVAELERDGHNTVEAKKLLEQFEKLQEMHKADRDRIERELAAG